MPMLDDAHRALTAAVSAHHKLGFELYELAKTWGATATTLCPDYPDCDHDYDSDEHERHGMTVVYLDLAAELLDKINKGKICCKCDRRIINHQLIMTEPEKCIHCKEPG